ncbi:MAG TPA: hypothetical protein VIO38_13900 [Rariglobus sp.]
MLTRHKLRDYYENHDRPKRLYARELVKNARRSLQAEHLKPVLAAVEAKVPVRSVLKAAELKSLGDRFRAVTDYRSRIGQYLLFALLASRPAPIWRPRRGGKKIWPPSPGRLSSRQRAALGDPQRGYRVSYLRNAKSPGEAISKRT